MSSNGEEVISEHYQMAGCNFPPEKEVCEKGSSVATDLVQGMFLSVLLCFEPLAKQLRLPT